MTFKDKYLSVYQTAVCELKNDTVLFDKYVVYVGTYIKGVRTIMGWGPTPHLAWKDAVRDMGRKMMNKLES
jgi:hypothetical protein